MGVKREFTETYAGKVGTIEGEDDAPVELGAIRLSVFCAPETAAAFGCPPGSLGILAEWLPAGLTPDGGIDLATVPDLTAWVVFPKVFDGVPVHYKRADAAP